MDIKTQFSSAKDSESVKAIQTVKAMQFLHAKNVAYAGLNEDEIINLAGLTAAVHKDPLGTDASITDQNGFVENFIESIKLK